MPLGRRPKRTMARLAGPHYAARVRAFALVELGDSESIDLLLREEDAERALGECLGDEPDWTGLLYVVPSSMSNACRRARTRVPPSWTDGLSAILA